MVNAASLPAFLADVTVEPGETPRNLIDAAAKGVLWQASPGRFLIEAPGTARYLVEDGRFIRIDVKPAASLQRIAPLLRTAPLAALLYQRGIFACHGSAVATPKGALLITGVSGAGKSTLAAALLARGCRLLADEVVPIALDGTGCPVVHSTSGDIVLWPDSLASLFPAGLPHWIQQRAGAVSSRDFVVNGWEPAASVKLRAIIRLSAAALPRAIWEPAAPAARFLMATRMSWNTRIAAVLLDRGAHMRSVAALAPFVPDTGVVRSTVRWQTGELADRVMAEHG